MSAKPIIHRGATDLERAMPQPPSEPRKPPSEPRKPRTQKPISPLNTTVAPVSVDRSSITGIAGAGGIPIIELRERRPRYPDNRITAVSDSRERRTAIIELRGRWSRNEILDRLERQTNDLLQSGVSDRTANLQRTAQRGLELLGRAAGLFSSDTPLDLDGLSVVDSADGASADGAESGDGSESDATVR